MRTTVNLEPSAFEAARAKALHENVSLGKAISELIMQAVRPVERAGRKRARAVFKSRGGKYSALQVEAGLEDE
jgi:hypothetical protein